MYLFIKKLPSTKNVSLIDHFLCYFDKWGNLYCENLKDDMLIWKNSKQQGVLGQSLSFIIDGKLYISALRGISVLNLVTGKEEYRIPKISSFIQCGFAAISLFL